MKKQRGFTLIEFLVASAVTVIVVAGTLAAFTDAMHTNDNITQMTDMTDNLRAGLNLVVQDLIQAGTGIPTGGIPIPNTPNANGTCSTTAPPNRPAPANMQFPQCNFSLPAIEPGANLGPRITSPDTIPGTPTDILTILYADYGVALDADPINRPASANTPACNGTFVGTTSVTFDRACLDLAAKNITVNPGDLIMFSNAQGNAIQTVSGTAGAQTILFNAGDAFNLNGRPDPAGTMRQLQFPNGTYPPTTATRIWMISYYLDNVANPAQPRLMRQVNFNLAQAVGETIEDFRVTYNFIDGATNPSNQPTIPAGLSETQIRSVNVFVGARSNLPNKLGQYLRNSLTTQVSLRSMAYVNRYK